MEQGTSFKSSDKNDVGDLHTLIVATQYLALIKNQRSYTCGICKIQFVNEIDLISHQQIHAMRKNRCKQNCKITFQVYTSLYQHNYKEHGLFPKYICPYCFKNYRQYINYYYHSIQVHDCRCDICFEQRPNYPMLIQHYKESHPEEKKREIGRYNRSQEKKLRELRELLEDLDLDPN